jgi:hypothetical protein
LAFIFLSCSPVTALIGKATWRISSSRLPAVTMIVSLSLAAGAWARAVPDKMVAAAMAVKLTVLRCVSLFIVIPLMM